MIFDFNSSYNETQIIQRLISIRNLKTAKYNTRVVAYQSVSGESMTRRIFIFFAAGEPLGGKDETSSFESCFGLEGEVKFVVRSWLSEREGRRLLKFTPPDIFNFCKNSIFHAVTTLELCLKFLKTCNVEGY